MSAIINTKFNRSKDSYSDGDVENEILNLLDKYENNTNKAIEENYSWPVYYHLSFIRENIVKWYPFKKDAEILEVGAGMGAITGELLKHAKHVTSIELSKRRAESIYRRNKSNDNLEIIVGNYNDIKLDKKYDYIILNGVFEYANLYMHTKNPFIDFLNDIKTHLNKDGKILIAIENRFGLKYWCGANEDHNNLKFDGINNYESGNGARTFSKKEFEDLAAICNLNINFYYVFPDYKFPKVIYSDEAIKDGIFSNYSPYFSNPANVFIDEKKVYNDIYTNKVIPFFANSFFIELSPSKITKDVLFAKFNNEYRKGEYDLVTYYKDNAIYKKVNGIDSKKHLDNIYNIYNIGKKQNLDMSKVEYDKDELKIEYIKGENLYDILLGHIRNNNEDEIFNIYDKIYEIIKKSLGKKVSSENNIFDKYNCKVNKNIINSLTFYENGFIDMIPSNIVIKDNKYILIDQEWFEYGVPVEFIMYRSIYYMFDNIDLTLPILDKLYKKYGIKKEIYRELDVLFTTSVRNDTYKYYSKYAGNKKYITDNNKFLDSLSDLEIKVNNLETESINLKNRVNELEIELNNKTNELNSVLNTKGWKLLEKFRKIIRIIKRKK